MNWTILDPYGTPYGGERDNYRAPINYGGSGYEAPATTTGWAYGDRLECVAAFGCNNVGGLA
ncbi:hypothetical protein [Spirillospora sp. CA-294931]|uniref:hypothetical protein n=1 Tax=Spirillospora sp. CA-294931 TaxID=3240042 RepID=UPI003D9223A4